MAKIGQAEKVEQALFDRIAQITWDSSINGAEIGFAATSRRVKLFSDAPAQPAFYLHCAEEDEQPQRNRPPIVTMRFQIIIYQKVAKENPEGIPSQEINRILDAVRAALRPDYLDHGYPDNCTLGDLAHGCDIKGRVLRDMGDIDGQGLLIIPVEVILP